MSFTAAELVDIRRFCGYAAYSTFGATLESDYGLLETRLAGMSADEEAVIRTVYLANLTNLETAIPAVSDNLDTDQAAVWHHNKDELRDREALLDCWRRRLCGFIGVRPGNGLKSGLGASVIRT